MHTVSRLSNTIRWHLVTFIKVNFPALHSEEPIRLLHDPFFIVVCYLITNEIRKPLPRYASLVIILDEIRQTGFCDFAIRVLTRKCRIEIYPTKWFDLFFQVVKIIVYGVKRTSLIIGVNKDVLRSSGSHTVSKPTMQPPPVSSYLWFRILNFNLNSSFNFQPSAECRPKTAPERKEIHIFERAHHFPLGTRLEPCVLFTCQVLN